MSGADSDSENTPGDAPIDDMTQKSESNTGGGSLQSPPPLYSTSDYKINDTQFSPKLVKSLMHRKVIKISSGGVHNICIVEPQPNSLMEDIYKQFMEGKFTNVIFKGFFQTYDEKQEAKIQVEKENNS